MEEEEDKVEDSAAGDGMMLFSPLYLVGAMRSTNWNMWEFCLTPAQIQTHIPKLRLHFTWPPRKVQMSWGCSWTKAQTRMHWTRMEGLRWWWPLCFQGSALRSWTVRIVCIFSWETVLPSTPQTKAAGPKPVQAYSVCHGKCLCTYELMHDGTDTSISPPSVRVSTVAIVSMHF